MISNCIDPYKQTKYKLIACAVLSRECYFCAAETVNVIDVTIIEQGLHDVGKEKMTSRLQQELDKVDPGKYDAVLLGYGLCNNGIVGLHSKIPMVVPRAHDCITLLLGSKERYQNYSKKNIGAFYQSAGWLEQYIDNLSNPESTTSLLGIQEYEDYVEKYGVETAEYITNMLGGGADEYEKFTYIDTKVGDQEKLKNHTRQNAEKNGWKYEELKGDINLLMKMMNGGWNKDEFLIVEPGQTIQPSYGDGVIEVDLE